MTVRRELVMGRSVLHWARAFVMVAVPLVGCTDVSEFRTYRFIVTESLPDLTARASEGVEICEADTDNCVTTGFGRADLEVPSNQEVTFTLEKEGFGPLLIADVSDEAFGGLGDGGPAFLRMYPHDQLAAIAAQLQTPYPWEGGIVALATVPDLAGVTFTPVGSTIEMVGEPFYFDEPNDQYSLDLEATTVAAGDGALILPLGAGGFTEVAPEEQQFELGGTAGDCARAFAWPGDAPNTIRVPVREGYTTYGIMFCD